MSPAQVIESMLRAGTTIRDAFREAREKDAAVDWAAFLKSKEAKEAFDDVSDLIAAIKGGALVETLHATRKKMADLRANRKLIQLQAAELTQYNALLDVEAQLTVKLIKDPGITDLPGWLVNEALPVLAKVAGVVIPLLL